MNTYIQLDLFSEESKGISAIMGELKQYDEFESLEITWSSSYNGSFIEYKEPESIEEKELIEKMNNYLKNEKFEIDTNTIEREPKSIDEDSFDLSDR